MIKFSIYSLPPLCSCQHWFLCLREALKLSPFVACLGGWKGVADVAYDAAAQAIQAELERSIYLCGRSTKKLSLYLIWYLTFFCIMFYWEASKNPVRFSLSGLPESTSLNEDDLSHAFPYAPLELLSNLHQGTKLENKILTSTGNDTAGNTIQPTKIPLYKSIKVYNFVAHVLQWHSEEFWLNF